MHPAPYTGTAAAHFRGHQHNNHHAQAQTPSQLLPLTPTAMGRWSVSSSQLPPVDLIKALHVYDFDNTRESAACAKVPLLVEAALAG